MDTAFSGIAPVLSTFHTRLPAILAWGALLLTPTIAVAQTPRWATGLTATVVSVTQINLRWTDNSDNEQAFEVQRRTYSGAWSTIATLPANAVSHADTGLTPLTTYLYRVRPTNAAGPALYWSNEAWAETAVPPAAPTDLSGSLNSSNQLVIRWTDNSTDEQAFAIFWRGELAENPFTRIATVGPNTTQFTCPDWVIRGPGILRVRATSAGGASGWSNEWNWIHPNAPPTPGDFRAIAHSGREIELHWNNNGLTTGEIRIMRTVDGWWQQQETVSASTGRWTDLRCRPGITYYYRIRTVVNGLNSSLTNEIRVTTPAEP